MAPRQSRAIFLAAVKRYREDIRIYSPYMGKEISAWRNNFSEELGYLSALLTSLTEDTRTDAFIQFGVQVPAKLDDLIYDLVGAYGHSCNPNANEPAKVLTEEIEGLRKSVQQLLKFFSIPVFDDIETGVGRMRREDRLQLLDRLGQAALRIDLTGLF
jgi:hypothetical protein